MTETKVYRNQTVIKIEEGSLILLIAPPGSGKTTFSKRMKKCNIISYDDIYCVKVMESSKPGFPTMIEFISQIDHSLEQGKTTVVDAILVDEVFRKMIIDLTKKFGHRNKIIGIVLGYTEKQEIIQNIRNRNIDLSTRYVEEIISKQCEQLKKEIENQKLNEGLDELYILYDNEIKEAKIELIEIS